MLMQAVERGFDMDFDYLDSGLKEAYIEKFLKKTFDTVAQDYFKTNIEPLKLTENMMKTLFVKNIDGMSFVLTAFLMLDKSLSYYKSKNNEVMQGFIEQSIMEANLMLLESDYQGADSIHLTLSEEGIIEKIVEKILFA